MRARERIEGTTINSLHVDKYLGDNYYSCTCLICGNTRTCRTYELKNGKYKACKECENTPGLTGSTIGNWKLLHKSEKGYPYWECECLLCHNQYTVNIKNVRKGKSSCCTACSNKLRTTDISTKKFKLGRAVKYIGAGSWECECGICGKNVTRSITKLKEQNEILCNQCSAIRLRKDLTGKTFGNWEVIKRVDDGASYHSRWLCKCMLCGKESKVYTYNLLSRHSESCGCQSLIDLTDKQFNELHVDKYLGEQHWQCTCSCGKIISVHSNELRSGAAKSCGCKKWHYARETMLARYGEVLPQRIGNPRTREQIDAVETAESLRNFIEGLGYKPKTYELCALLGINTSCTLKTVHKFGLDDLVDIGSKNSKQHTEILNYIYKFIHESDVIVNDRELLNGKELDIYIPSKKLAIEVNGSYWHSDIFKGMHYHQNKSILCGQKGVQLIHIFEHEWENLDTQEKLKNLLKYRLTKPDRVLYARKCEVKEIDSSEYTNFLDKWHLQKSANTAIKLGCYYDNELVGVMGFGSPRFIKQYEYELIRLCWKCGTVVTGGLQKLFKYFLDKYKPQSILTYSDLSKFTGSSYLKLNFKPIDNNTFSDPNYTWIRIVSPGVYDVLPRYRTQKHKLLEMNLGNENETEDDIMTNIGYVKVYDSGSIRLEWKASDNIEYRQ